MLEGKANFRINCRNASAGLTEFEQLCFRHKPLHVRERYLYRVRLETCVVWAPWREWSSILLVGNSQYTTLGFTRHTKERDTGGKKTRLFCLFLIIHAREGCSLSFVSVSWHMYRYNGAGCVHICVTLCVFCNCRDVPVKCMNISLSVCVFVRVLCAHGRRGAGPAILEAAAFLHSPNQSEEGSTMMSPAVWADGLFKSTTDDGSSVTTLPHALIASNEVMKEMQHSQPELSCSARCSSTCLCRMSGN